MIQLLIRTIRKLPSSQLEIAVLAFSISSLITYLILWGRPRGINRRYRIAADRLPREIDVQRMGVAGPEYLLKRYRGEDRVDGEYGLVPIPNDAIHPFSVGLIRSMMFVAGGAIFGGVVFGAIHCLAWNFHFPTPIEALLWRICAVLTTILPIISVFPNFVWALFSRDSDFVWRHVAGIVLIMLVSIYVLARLFLLVEIFRSLFYLPPGAFNDTWSGSSFPHWG